MNIFKLLPLMAILGLVTACGGGGASSVPGGISSSVGVSSTPGGVGSSVGSSSSNAIIDSDDDGVPDAVDAFPQDKSEWLDTDKDGFGDNSDKAPMGELMPAWNTFQGNQFHNGLIATNLDSKDFKKRWSKPFTMNGVAQGAAGDGYIFVNAEGVLSTFRAATGEVLWSVTLTASNPPAYADGIVYVETGGYESAALWAFNAKDGALIFKAPIDDQWSSYYAPTVVDGVAYVAGGHYGGMYAIDAKTGEQKWWVGLNQYDQFTPAVTDDYAIAYTGSYSPQLTVVERDSGEVAFAIPDPKFEWNGWSMNLAPVVSGDSVVVIHNNRLVHFNLTTKAVGWDIKDKFTGQPSIKDGRIYAINNGKVEVYDLVGGALIESISGSNAFTGDLLLVNNLLFARDSANIYAYDLTTKKKVWTLSNQSGAFFMADDALYVLSNAAITAVDVLGDMDQDGLPDWWERSLGKNIDPASDTDNDQLTAAKEFENSTDPFNPDTDNDGLLDGLEVVSYLSSPIAADSDKDGLNDADEVNTHHTNPNLVDTDGDSIKDALEVAAGLDPLDASDTEKDKDNDGYSNRHEVLASTNPSDATSFPKVADWAMLHGNSKHTSYQPLMLKSEDFALRWTTTVKGSATAVATGNGRIFLNDGINTISLNAGTGDFIWSYPFAGGSTSYADGKVYGHIGGHQATAFIGLDAVTGALKFSSTHGDQWSSYSAPTIYNGHAYVNGGYYGGMVAFNASNGAKEWEISSPVVDWSSMWEPAVSELGLFAVGQNKLRSLSPTDGSLIFEMESSLAISSQTPVIGSRGNVFTAGPRVVSYDIGKRKVSWQSEANAVANDNYTNIAVGNSEVYALSSGSVTAFDESNGRIIWRKTLSNSSYLSNIALTASHLFVADSNNVYAIDLTSRLVVWSYPKGGQYLSIGNEGALFVANGTEVFAIEIEGDKDSDGMPDWWERNYGGNLIASADLDSDGLTNLEEYTNRTNPTIADTDSDSITDFQEVRTYSTNPLIKDSDKDGLADNIEIQQHGTNPLLSDTDSDGLDDSSEVQYGLDPNDATDGSEDTDGDGFSNANEIAASTDLNNALSFPVAHDWAMLQGNAGHDGFQPVLLTTSNFNLRWSKDFGYAINGACTGGDNVFITTKTWFGVTELTTIDAATAAVKWTHNFGELSSMSSPSYSADIVYVHSGGHDDTAFWAFNATTGTQKFRSPHGSQWPTYSAPTLYGNQAFMNGGYYGGIVAFDTSTGGKLWEGTASWVDSLEPTVNDTSVFIPADNTLVARNRTTGVDQYAIETSLSSTSLVLGKLNNIIAVGTTVKSIDLTSREVKWTTVQNNIAGTPAVGNQSVYFVSSGTLYAVKEIDGGLLWSWTPPGSTITHNIISTLSHIFVSTNETTYAIDVYTGLRVWSYDRGGELSLGSDGNLYIASGAELHAIQLTNQLICRFFAK